MKTDPWLGLSQTKEVLELHAHNRSFRMYAAPGSKIDRCLRAGQPYEAGLLEHIYKRGFSGVAIDAGANVGNHTLWFHMICGLSVVAFEPLKHQQLERNVQLNGYAGADPWVAMFRCALGSSPNVAGHVSKGRLALGQGQVPVSTLDAVLDRLGASESIALIKIDVEGMEPDVIRGARETLRRHRPIVYVEENDSAAIEQALSAALPYERTARFGKASVTPVGEWSPVK